MLRRLPLLLVCLLVFPLAAQSLRFADDVPVAAVEYDDPGLANSAGAVATNGDGYLAVWHDSRRGQSVSWLAIGTTHVYASRLAADGTLLDPAGIYIGAGFGAEVVWTGRSYVVAWTSSEGLHVAAVAPDGTISGRRTLPSKTTFGAPEMASNGTTIALITSSGELFILDLDLGVVAQRDARPVTGAFNRLSIAAAAGQYLIATTNTLGLSLRTVADDGTLTPYRQLGASTSATDVDVASDGQSYMVMWRTELNALMAQRVTTTNVESGDAVTLVRGSRDTTNVTRQLQAPGISWRNGEYFATYHFVSSGTSSIHHDLYAMRVSRDGAPIGSIVSVARTRSTERPDFATKSDGSGVMVWVDRERRLRAGYFDNVSLAAGVPFFREVSAASAARTQTRASITAVDHTAVVLWHEASANLRQLRIARENGSPVVVADSIAPRWQDVVFDGTAVWVLWSVNDTELWLRRFTPQLEATDAAPRSIHLGRSEIAAVVTGDGAVALVWRRLDGVALQLTTFRSSGDAVASSTVTVDGQGASVWGDAALVWDGTTFTVVWRRLWATESPSGLIQHNTLNVARVHPSGSGRPSMWTILETRDSSIHNVHAAAANGEVTLAWQQAHKDGGRNAYVARLEYSGANITPVVFDDDPRPFRLIEGLVAHEDGAVDVLTWNWDVAAAPWEATIGVRRVPAMLTGVPREFTTTFPITRQPGNEPPVPYASVTHLDAVVIGGATVIAYERQGSELEGDVSRVFLRHERGTSRRRSVR